jgi:hypothetical protein
MRFSTLRSPAIASLALVVVALAGCPGDGADGAEGEGEGEGGGVVVDAGCDADDACGAGLVCDLATSTCVAGFDCSVNTTICGFCGSPDVDCGFGEAPAFCDEDAGVCRRVKGACAPCSADDECGEGPTGLPSVCSGGFCAPGCGPCADGFTCTDGGCVPLPGTTTTGTCDGAILCGDGTPCPDGTVCGDFGVCLSLCASDVDCALGDICQDEGPARNTCVTGCSFGQRVNVDGEDQICHGDGRFGPLCPTPGETTGCPPSTECTASGACDLAGCQSDAECPLPRTYCDVASATCVTGCNDGGDCNAFELCEDNVCVAQGCRSKDSSCNLGEFCCGQEFYADASTCPAPVQDGACFLAPEPWCQTCEDDDDCRDGERFGFSAHCFELTRQNPETGQDESLGKFCSTGCRDNDDCPRGIPCVRDLPTPDGGTTQGCMDARCAGFPADR